MIDRYARPEMKRVWSESSKHEKWLQVEVAICEAWTDAGAIPAAAMQNIRKATYDPARVEEVFQETRHDMTAFLRSVQENVGPDGRFIHLGLTSYDVQDNALGLQLVEASEILARGIDGLTEVLVRQAVEHKHTVTMGRTHGVHAEPTSFGMKLLVWVDEMRRNAERLKQARDVIAVGKVSGAVGSHATVPPSVETSACRRLGLRPAAASTQTLQRDRHGQFVQTVALIAASLEKFATEIRGLQRTEIREVEEPFAEGQTGSSAMPHKRNPELAERICGLARLVRGHAVTALENVALWHERDISHSSAERMVLPDSCMALDYMLDLFTFVMRGLRVFPERMLENFQSSRGLVYSQRILLALIEKGLDRHSAYRLVQDDAMKCWDTGTPFREILENDPAIAAHLAAEELDGLFDHRYYLRHVEEVFQRSGL